MQLGPESLQNGQQAPGVRGLPSVEGAATTGQLECIAPSIRSDQVRLTCRSGPGGRLYRSSDAADDRTQRPGIMHLKKTKQLAQVVGHVLQE